MKRFDFKLQPLLNYREYLERIARQNTAKAHMDVTHCQGRIADLKQTRETNAQIVEGIVAKGVSAAEFKQHHQYLDAVENQIKDEKTKKIQLTKILKEKLLALKKKSIDKKVMEIYRERLLAEYTQKMIKIEQKQLDEISSLKAARKVSHEALE